MKKGIFWCKDYDTDFPLLITVAVPCDINGLPNETVAFSSKSGENFNHKIEWSKLPKSITQGKPFNYYPRGRVGMKNGKATVFLNPDIHTERIIRKVLDTFEITENSGLKSIRVKADGSRHYRYSCNETAHFP